MTVRSAREALKAEVQRLLDPINPTHPAGESLRYDPVYDAIQAARREDDASLPQGVWEAKLRVADWPRVEKLIADALAGRSKDVQLAAWLTEAWLVLHGLPGLEAGLELVRGLFERYSEGLHPGAEGRDAEARMGPVAWLDEKVSGRVALVPVAAPPQGGMERPFRVSDWQRAQRLERLGQPPSGEAETTAHYRAAAALTPPGFYAALGEDVRGALRAAVEIGPVLDREAGRDAPAMLRLRGALEEIERVLRECASSEQIAALVGLTPADSDDEEGAMAEAEARPEGSAATAGEEAAAAVASGPRGGPIKSRAEAYRLLAQAADYLIKTEPHSPTPYLVRRAIAWGSMPLEKVLLEMMHDSADLPRIYELLGLIKKE